MELRTYFATISCLSCLIVLISCFDIVSSDKPVSLSNPCPSKQTCHECIQTPSCAWCAQRDYSESNKRCFMPNTDPNDPLLGCDESFLINPQNYYSILENRTLGKVSKYGSQGGSRGSYGSETYESASSSSSSSYNSHSEAVQISPQRVQLKLRIGEAHRMAVNYAQASDYPVDLYYLMDLSKSMADDKDKLSSLGGQLARTMQSITSNFRLGFGSFVDKVVMPFVSTVPKNLIEPCPGCEAPYGYHNNMPLNQNTSAFSQQVQSASVSGNLDGPEGGFDAIMQAIVCKEQIGWRDEARRLLVFSTDAGFHYAGDGKLGGIVKPNDGLCHLDKQNRVYTHSTEQDYPSISQINYKIKQNAINLIFAVTAEQLSTYERLSQFIEGSSSGVLSNDSSNVVELVQKQYEKISSSVEMKDTSSKDIKVTYYTNCLDSNAALEQKNKCDGLHVGTVVQFQVEIEVAACPADRRLWKQSFDIYPVGVKEKLNVEIDMQCECDCENPGEHLSPSCSGAGTYKCGICECETHHFGRHCECDSENNGGSLVGCKADANSTVECSGRGNCLCNLCSCNTRSDPNEKIFGQYCECDNFSCDRHNGLLCSGPDHGTCDCGKCICKPGWTGSACDCRASTETCIPRGGGEICSGKGKCECGVCKCIEDAGGRYSGKYCEKCPTCPGKCSELRDCVQCMAYKSGVFSEEECARNCSAMAKPILVTKVEANEEKDENLCSFFDEDQCKFEFVYAYDNQGKVFIRAQKEPLCPPHVYILGLVLGVIGAIVLIGLAFLCLWKILTSIHDSREFAKFEKERMLAKWDTGENPIYKQATSTFTNPTYGGRKYAK